MLGLGRKKYFLFYIIGFLYSSSLFSMEQEDHFKEELEQLSESDQSVIENKTFMKKWISKNKNKKSSLFNSSVPKKSSSQREEQENNLEKDSKKIEEENSEEINNFPQKPTVSKDSYLPEERPLSPQTKEQLSNSKTQQNTPQKDFFNQEKVLERKQYQVQRNLFQEFNQERESLPSQIQQEVEISNQSPIYGQLTQKEIDLFLDEVVGKAKIPSNSELFMTLAPKALEGMENQREVLKDLSYGFQLLGDWFLCEEAKERASLAYYQSYQFNPENQELLDFFNKNGILNTDSVEEIKRKIRNEK